MTIYSQALNLEFYLDDWSIMEMLGKLGPLEYALRSLNPLTPDFLNTYRPFQGILLAVEYSLFGATPTGYHLVHIALHLINSVLLFVVVAQVTFKCKFAMLVSFFYATLPLYGLAVFLLSATDVIATLFYLLAVYAWTKYLRTFSNRWFAATFTCFVLGLFSKEFVVTLPIVLFALEFLLDQKSKSIAELLRRYLWFGIATMIFVLYEVGIIASTANFRAYGTSVGSHVVVNVLNYLTKLFVPWNVDSAYLLPIGVAAALIIFAMARQQRALLIFTLVWGLLNILPVVGFQRKVDPRFLYVSGVAPAVWLAAFSDQTLRLLKRWRFAPFVILFGLNLILIGNGIGVALAANDYAADSRAQRAPFRDIARLHPTLPEDTFLYMINVPVSLRDLSGMFYLKYKNNVTMSELLNGTKAQLRDHQNSIIYYFDDTRKPIEVQVEKDIAIKVSPQVPTHFEQGIDLLDYELSSDSIKRGESMVLLLYWKAGQSIDRDYTVFLHLVDQEGTMITGVDGQPALGKSPTSTWQPGKMVVDAMILPIDQDVVATTNARLEIGLYHAPTMQRLSIIDENGSVITDHVTFDSIRIQ